MRVTKVISTEERIMRFIVADTMYAKRRALRLSQKDLGNLVGVSTVMINHLESGMINLRLDTLVRIAKCLKMDIILEFKNL